MKTKQLFGGLFFLSMGVVFLLEKYTSFCIDYLRIDDLWPLFLVFLGLIIMFRESKFKPYLSALGGVLLGLVVYAFFAGVFSFIDDEIDDIKFSSSHYSESYSPDIKTCNLNIEGGMGKFIIKSSTDDLITAKSYGYFGNYDFTVNKGSDYADIDLTPESNHVNFPGFNKSKKSRIEVKLNTAPIWNISLKTGASDSYFDLSEFKVKECLIETGASHSKIKLGDLLDEAKVDVQMGAASLEILIPSSVGCKIDGEMVLMSRDINGFTKHKNGESYYISDNYETATKKIFINVEGGVSSIKVDRY